MKQICFWCSVQIDLRLLIGFTKIEVGRHCSFNNLEEEAGPCPGYCLKML